MSWGLEVLGDHDIGMMRSGGRPSMTLVLLISLQRSLLPGLHLCS